MGPAVAVQEPWSEAAGVCVFVWAFAWLSVWASAVKAIKSASAIIAGFMSASVVAELVLRGNFVPGLFGWQTRTDGLLQLVGALGVVGIIANEHFAREFFFRSDGADGGLKPLCKFSRGRGVGIGKNYAEESGSEQIHRIGRAEIAADGARDFSHQRGGFVCIGNVRGNANLDGQQRERAFHS